MSQPIMFFASEIAACVDMNPYQKPQEMLDKMFERENPRQFRKMKASSNRQVNTEYDVKKYMSGAAGGKLCRTVSSLVDAGTMSRDAQGAALEAVMKKQEEGREKKVVELVKEVKDLDAAKEVIITKRKELETEGTAVERKLMETKLEEVQKESEAKRRKMKTFEIIQAVPAPSVDQLIDFIKTKKAHTDGKKNERSGIQSREKVTGKKVTENNSQFYKKAINDWLLGGRTDGKREGKVYEHKRRQNRFLGLPTYELVQIHAYMVLTEVRSAVHCEEYKGECRETNVEFDDDFWDGVVNDMDLFVVRLEDYMDLD